MGFSPEECVVIEDSIAGVRAARKGGFDVYGYANAHNHEQLAQEGAKVFFKMEELHEVLGG